MNKEEMQLMDDLSNAPTRVKDGVVEHVHTGCGYWHSVDMSHSDSIDRVGVLLRFDDAISNLVFAKSIVADVGKRSEHVQQARCDQFVTRIDEVMEWMLKVGAELVNEMEDTRK